MDHHEESVLITKSNKNQAKYENVMACDHTWMK